MSSRTAGGFDPAGGRAAAVGLAGVATGVAVGSDLLLTVGDAVHNG